MDILERLQEHIAAKLRSDTFFDNFPIYSVRSRTVEEQVAMALSGTIRRNGLAGLAIQVLMPTLQELAPVPSGKASRVACIVRVQEIPEINFGAGGTEVSSEDVAMRVAQELHMFNDDGGTNHLQCDTGSAVTPSLEYAPRLTYDVTIIKPITLAALTRCASVTFAVTTTVTLASTTSGASIYYSTNADVFPSAAAGTLYSAPFAKPAVGTVIYAAAYKTGSAGSHVTKTTIS